MSDFATQTFERLARMANDMGEFGPAPLYAAIGHLLEDDQPDLAYACLAEAASIHGDEEFIVEGVTTNNEVFMEIFRRVSFTPPTPAEFQADNGALYRKLVIYMANFLTGFLTTLAHNNGKLMIVVDDGAANDGNS
jgi:hypothetical protein